jgi:hypothetical protein
MNSMFGKPAVAMPRWASTPDAHLSRSSVPSVPLMSSLVRPPETESKPVANTMMSNSRSIPSAVRMPRSLTDAMGVSLRSTRETLSWLKTS